MPLTIQRVPTGLLDLLSSKAGGVNPQLLADAVALVLGDAADYYLAQRRSTVQGTTAIAMTGNGNFNAVGVVVPSNEVWLAYGITARLNTPTAVATALRYWGTFTRTTATNFPMALTPVADVGAADNAAVCKVWERPGVFLPGDQFGLSTGAATGVPGSNGIIILDVARLTI